jgi:hypothetical protein
MSFGNCLKYFLVNALCSILELITAGANLEMPAITVALWDESKNEWIKINHVLNHIPSIIKYGDEIYVYQTFRQSDGYHLYRKHECYEIEPVKERVTR